MPELGDELRRLAAEGAREAQPMAPAKIMRDGDRRRRRRVLRDGCAAVAVTGAVVAVISSGTLAGPHATTRPPETRSSILAPSRTRHRPAPTSRGSTAAPTQSPSSPPRGPSPAPRRPTPSPSPQPKRSLSPGPTPTPSP